MKTLRVLYAYMYKDLINTISYRFGLFLGILGALGITIVFYYIGEIFSGYIPPVLEGYGGYFPFVIIGFSFMGYLQVGLSSFAGTLSGEQMQGTLEATIGAGVSPLMLSLVSPMFGYIRVTIRTGFYLLLAYLFLGMPELSVNIPVLILTIVISLLPYTGLGMISGAFILVFKRGNPVNMFYGGLSMLISGVYFPYEMLPAPIQYLAQVFPLTHCLTAIRGVLLRGYGFQEVSQNLLILLIMGVIFVVAGIISIHFANRKALLDGSYSHY